MKHIYIGLELVVDDDVQPCDIVLEHSNVLDGYEIIRTGRDDDFKIQEANIICIEEV